MREVTMEGGRVELHELIIEAFAGSPFCRGFRKVVVEVQPGRIRLSGEVGSYYLKQLATEACKRVAGRNEIDNLISVPEMH